MSGFTPNSPFDYKVTPHITAGELAKNQERRRFVAQHQCDTAHELCEFIERARSHFGGKPVIITSGYRPPAVNRGVGASGSEHLYNAVDKGAIDFAISGVSLYMLQDWVLENWNLSVGRGAHKGFVHVGMRQGRPKVRWNY